MFTGCDLKKLQQCPVYSKSTFLKQRVKYNFGICTRGY